MTPLAILGLLAICGVAIGTTALAILFWLASAFTGAKLDAPFWVLSGAAAALWLAAWALSPIHISLTITA